MYVVTSFQLENDVFAYLFDEGEIGNERTTAVTWISVVYRRNLKWVFSIETSISYHKMSQQNLVGLLARKLNNQINQSADKL